jgi:hypothetical protein
MQEEQFIQDVEIRTNYADYFIFFTALAIFVYALML